MKRFFIPALAVVLLSGCSNRDENPTREQDGIIRIFTGIEEATISKAVATQSEGLTNVQFIRIDGTASPTDFSSATPAVGDITAVTGAVIFGVTPSYNKDNHNAYFIAYHPAGSLSAGKVTWTIDGATDILRTNAVWDAGKYTEPLTGATGTKLTLNHQLSQVEVICQAEPNADIASVNAAWGKVKSIELMDAPTQMSYTLNGLAIETGSVAPLSLNKNYDGDPFTPSDIASNGTSTPIAQAMVAPINVTPATCSFKLKITTEGATAETSDDIVKEINISLNGDFSPMVAGNNHKVTLTFKADNRTISVANSTIDEWKPGHSASTDVEK